MGSLPFTELLKSIKTEIGISKYLHEIKKDSGLTLGMDESDEGYLRAMLRIENIIESVEDYRNTPNKED